MSHDEGRQSAAEEDQLGERDHDQMPTASTPGWLHHVPALSPSELPHAPTSFVMDATADSSNDNTLWPSGPASYTEFLLGNHPAYAPPPEPDDRQASTTASNWSTAGAQEGRSIVLQQHSNNLGTHATSQQSFDLGTIHETIYNQQSRGGTPTNPLYHALPPSHQIPHPPQEVEGGESESEFEVDHSKIDPQLLDPTSKPVKPRGRPKRVREEDFDTDADHEPSPKRRRGERGRGRRKGDKAGPRPVIAPGEDFTKVYNRALDAFVEKRDFHLAHTLVLQSIGLNPEIYAAHSLLADIHFAQGNHESGIDALMVGLHAHTNDIELWRHIADRILSIGSETYRKRVERAMYCYSAILRKDAKDSDARFQRSECARILKSYNRAFADVDILMQDDPRNSSFLAQFATLCQECNDIPKACRVYDEHFEYYTANGISEESHFTWADISVYVGLLIQQSQTVRAVQKLKELSRLLCGRQDETFWDSIDDDREFDQMHYPRRLEIPDFVPNKHPEEVYGDALPLDLRGKLGVLRLKLGFREEAWSHFEWLEPDLEGDDSIVEEYSDTFYEIANALHNAKEHEQALHFFDALCNADIDLGLDFWMDMGASCLVCTRKDRAIECFRRVLELDQDNITARTELTKLYKDLGDRPMAIKYGNEAVVRAQAAIPQTMNRKYERKEQRLIREAAEDALKKAFRMPKVSRGPAGKVPQALMYRSRRANPFTRYVPEPSEEPEPTIRVPRQRRVENGEEPETTPTPFPEFANEPPMYDRPIKIPRRPGRPSQPRAATKVSSKQADLARRYEEMQQLYQTLLSHQQAMRDGDEVATNLWMDCAAAMTDDFRAVKAFYPNEKTRRFEGYNSANPQPVPESGSPNGSMTPRRRIAPVGMPDNYCGIPFVDWLDIFLELAILYATASPSAENQTDCYATLNALIDCALFRHDLQIMTSVYSCYLSCSLALSDDATIYTVVLRWFMREYAFCTDTFRLYQTVTLLNELPPVKGGKAGQLDRATYKAGPNQKFVFRQLISIDRLLPDDYNKAGPDGGVPQFMRKHRDEARKHRTVPSKKGDEGHDSPGPDEAKLLKTHTPKEMDVVLFVLYGQLMMASNSFTNALSYLYRAYSLDPTNSVCLLTMAFCYLHELFKRQTNNRHSFAMLGWAWFGKYEDARMAWARDIDSRLTDGSMQNIIKQEIEYNRARCFEMLGMVDLGVRSYNRVLGTVTDGDEWTMESAYAMSTLYAFNGNIAKAREITETYLVV